MNKHLEYKGYMGSIEPDLDEGFLFGRLMFIRDVVSYQAGTLLELKAAFEAAVDDYLATCAELGEAPEVPCKGSFNVRVGPALHQKIAVTALKESISLNEWIRAACVEKLRETSIASSNTTAAVVFEATFQEETFISAGEPEWQRPAPLRRPVHH